MNTDRLEAFSDGVLAVAITLLVLDLKVTPGQGTLARQLAEDWPAYAAYLISFAIIGIIWVNHHALFGLVARVDRWLLFYNLMLLFSVTSMPFVTSTLAHYLQHAAHASHADARLAAVLYGADNILMAISYTLMFSRMINHGLLKEPIAPEDGRRAVRRFGMGLFVYPVLTLIGLASPGVMLALFAALSVYYVLEQTPLLPADAEKRAGPT
jgi:uncharacterized membrane protein